MDKPKRKLPVTKPKPKPNLKQANLAHLVQKKKECEKKAHEIVLRLIEPESEPPVDKQYLLDNAMKISKSHMEDVIEERKLSQVCEWVLCQNKIDPEKIPKQTYAIRGKKVYDITERKAFCGGRCYAKATHFKAQMLTSPLWLRDMEEENRIQFEVLEDEETKELHGINVAMTSVKLTEDEEDEKEREELGECGRDRES